MIFKLHPDPETRWRWAIAAWADGDTTRVLKLLAGDAPVPDFARAWLANAVLGKVKRRRGPKSKPPSLSRLAREIQVRADFHSALAVAHFLAYADAEDGRVGDTPTNRAIASLALKHGLSEDAISRIVFPRKARISRK